ncbi:hypothetical protein MGYG_07836 [Nannizzia gypsea CBS 118893]|uniref:LysR family regulatory protein n=1 Tax=Arthroderma gypseum (strain ATCC MYA-4604 / CBS 118893) TaxID=535722 RepID=E4V4A6_ARTGP|nr:hypothetical protein MGYG_07836 [Nannizzia gypsea CBS 118893]EFR04830.1 hypothetical protein MGYG_07836 [Nannizzia gypsea CBS 118893]
MDVYPVHLLDNADDYRKIVMSYIFRFSDVLDGQKLADSLSALLEIGDWRKLGGRFKLNKDGNLEIHVPRQFTPEAPAVTFSQKIIAASVDTDPLGKQLPKLTGCHPVQRTPPQLRDFAGTPSPPRSIKEMLERDATLLHLHVVCFSDATVVGITWPHVLMDAMGLQALLRNWSLVLDGKAEDVLPLAGARDDPVQELLRQDAGPAEAPVLEKLSFGLLGTVTFLFRLIWMKLRNPGFEQRTIIFPQDRLNQLCARARSDLESQGEKELFLGEGDVLAAWAARVLAASQPRPHLATIVSVVNFRFTLSALQGKGAQYIQNMLQLVYVSLARGWTAEPFGFTALAHRQQLAEQCTESQTLSYLRMQQDHIEAKGKLRLLFGNPKASVLMVNNLAKLDFFRNIDFSAAVVRRDPTRPNPPGAIVYYHTQVMNDHSVFSSYLGVLGKDHSGRILINGTFPTKTWELIIQELKGEI